MKIKHRKLLNAFHIQYGAFSAQTLRVDLKQLATIFTPTELINHFQPDGVISKEPFDHFLAIHYQKQLVGYYKISILDFSNEIELHAGIKLNSPFLNRSYFQLTKQFVCTIAKQFPAYDISVWVDPQNTKIQPLLQFVGFEKSAHKMQGFTHENYRL
jgi:hypothetical protein